MSWSGDIEIGSMQENVSETRRSKSGCTLCRARKVKCDEKWPNCLNCERLQLDCPGPPAPGAIIRPRPHRQGNRDTELTQAGTLRQRVAKSCHPCRVAKTRCSGGSICGRCASRGLDCTSAISSRRTKNGRGLSPRHFQLRRGIPADINSTSGLPMRDTISILPKTVPGDVPSSSEWLYTSEIPKGERLYILVEEYFAHIHPLRCNAFVHKPSFMQQLDEDSESCRQNESLLHVICALGAKFFALNNNSQLSPEAVLKAGNQWARIAKAQIFVDLDDLSLEKLMTTILLYEHDLRIGSYASAFMLSSMTARMSQALQLNLENSADVLCTKPEASPINTETRRRLMWSCYLLDSWVGSGVNQLTLLEDRDLKIQLPCHSHNFSLGISCITETMDHGKVLSFMTNDHVPPEPSQNMGIEAYFIRLVSIRKKVLRYVKHLDTAKPPWQADSEFSLLCSEFNSWRRSLPPNLLWNPSTIYARKESSQLGALTLLWCTFYQTLVDLYRIGMPVLFRIQKEFTFPPEQKLFLEHCQKVCFENAREASTILSEALRHGLKNLADTWLCIIAHDGTKVILYYLKLQEAEFSSSMSQREREESITLVQNNLQVLLQMRSLVKTAEHCSLSVLKLMAAAGIKPDIPFATLSNENPSEMSKEISPSPESPAQESPENILNPLAIYRMARTALHGKQTKSPSSCTTPEDPSSASPRSIHRPENTTAVQASDNNFKNPLHISQHSHQWPFQDAGEISASIDQAHATTQRARESPSITTNAITSISQPAFGDIWDPTDSALMDMLDGGMTPWTADYLTDGQSGIDPFLFPF